MRSNSFISKFAKKTLKKFLPTKVVNQLIDIHRYYTFNSKGPYSDDQHITETLIRQLSLDSGCFIDIGAQDGVRGSQTLSLAKSGWRGLLIECDPSNVDIISKYYKKFANRIQIASIKINPLNILQVIENSIASEGFEYLSIDIDSYDYFVLEEILKKWKPKIICAEINELFPPPIRFTVLPNAKSLWRGDAFQGFSLQLGYELAHKYGYEIFLLHYNNLFLVKNNSITKQYKSLVEIYNDGYLNRSGRKDKFIHNSRYFHLESAQVDQVEEYFRVLFADREGEFQLGQKKL